MYLYPELQLAQFYDRQHELIAEADQHRLLTAALRWRRRSLAESDDNPAVQRRRDGTLTQCGPRAAAPAR